MMRPVVSATKRASARDIALQLLTGLYSGMPVTDEEGRVVGVITELDLLEAVAEGRDLIKTTAEEIMNREVMTANVETPVDDLIKIMTDQHVIRVPITDTAQGRLVGVVARCDVLRALLEPEFVTYS
jgi:CBS-domain-containing membrane protein